ncbi:MAG: conjugal transfer protein TrbL family protein [Dehalococcoidia bacterium]
MSAARLPVTVLTVAVTLMLALLTTPRIAAQAPPTAPTPAATPTPTTTPAPEGNRAAAGSGGPLDFLPDLVPDLLPDPKEWAADVFNQVLVTLLRGIADALRGAIGGVLDSSLNFITQTPAAGSYESPTVRSLWNVVRLIANAGLALVALWGGFNLIVREHLGSPYHEAMELFPRLVVGALLVNTSLAWGQLVIDASNTLCQAIGETNLPAWERANTATQLLVDVIATVIYFVTGLLLLLQMLMRLALIDVLLVASPLGLLCWVLPQTQGWARLWSSTFFSTVFTQFVQVLALKLGGSLLTDLTPMAADSALLSIFLGVAVLVLTLKIPSLMRVQTGDGLGFVRYISYRQGARAIEGRTGGGSRARGGA